MGCGRATPRVPGSRHGGAFILPLWTAPTAPAATPLYGKGWVRSQQPCRRGCWIPLSNLSFCGKTIAALF